MRCDVRMDQAKKQREKKERIEAKKKMMAAKRNAAKEADNEAEHEAGNLVSVSLARQRFARSALFCCTLSFIL